MPAIAIVADVIISDIIGASVVDAVATVTGSMLLGDIASGAVIGAIGGAASAAIQSGDIWKGVEMGALSGGVAGGVTGALEGAGLSGAVNAPPGADGVVPTDSFGNALKVQGAGGSLLPESLTATSKLGTAVASGLGTAAGGLATGQSLKTALEGGAIGGLVGYAAPGGGVTGGVERGLLSTGLRSALGVGDKQLPTSGSSPLITGSASRQAGSTPGSAALGQALNIGDASSPIFGGSGDEKNKKNVWNVQSLRYMGQPEESSGG